jgi:hypothetical protein
MSFNVSSHHISVYEGTNSKQVFIQVFSNQDRTPETRTRAFGTASTNA